MLSLSLMALWDTEMGEAQQLDWICLKVSLLLERQVEGVGALVVSREGPERGKTVRKRQNHKKIPLRGTPHQPGWAMQGDPSPHTPRVGLSPQPPPLGEGAEPPHTPPSSGAAPPCKKQTANFWDPCKIAHEILNFAEDLTLARMFDYKP